MRINPPSSQIYIWQVYERVILGLVVFCSVLPVFEIVYVTGYMFWTKGPPFLHEDITWVHVYIVITIHIVFFGLLACKFPKIYILPAWVLNLAAFIFYVTQVVTSNAEPYNLNIFLAVFMLFSLVTLFRPALFYFRVIWHKITR